MSESGETRGAGSVSCVHGTHADICYKALESHDPRFDGLFFVAVAKHGHLLPHRVYGGRRRAAANCTFHRSAAAAERAGFRPCLRCPAGVGAAAPGAEVSGNIHRSVFGCAPSVTANHPRCRPIRTVRRVGTLVDDLYAALARFARKASSQSQSNGGRLAQLAYQGVAVAHLAGRSAQIGRAQA